jgi:hypothetical protein
MQSVLLFMAERRRDALLSQIEDWYSERDDVTLLRYGRTRVKGQTLGFILIEFEELAPDRWFLSRLAAMKPRVDVHVLDSVEEEEEEDDG